MNKILVVHPNWVGDVIFSTAFIDALKTAYPESSISSMVVPRCAEVLSNNPRIDEIITYEEHGANRTLVGKFRFVRKLQSRYFSRAYILRRSLTRTIMLQLANIPVRIGFANKKSNILLTSRVPEPDMPLHRAAYFLELLRHEGLETSSAQCGFFIRDDDRKFVDQLLKASGLKPHDRFVVLNAGGNWELKRWPLDRFIELARRIRTELDIPIVLSGALKDVGLTAAICDAVTVPLINFAGKTTIKHAGALFERSKLVISNDSGPLHVASCFSTPTIALFGPTHPEITSPFRSDTATVFHEDVICNKTPCYMLNCTTAKCMKAITVDMVFEKVCEIL